uniref:Uncharacterized protein n=1 Tax=Rousettus aegyptiacus TaxID=9407 RepID=A0A7J8IL98_ROUAE|nr:hypothetical protein HJG63_010578 [Rousettus aegyptiacus]
MMKQPVKHFQHGCAPEHLRNLKSNVQFGVVCIPATETPSAILCPPATTTTEAFNQVSQTHKCFVKVGFYGYQLRDEFHVLVNGTEQRLPTSDSVMSYNQNLVQKKKKTNKQKTKKCSSSS